MPQRPSKIPKTRPAWLVKSYRLPKRLGPRVPMLGQTHQVGCPPSYLGLTCSAYGSWGMASRIEHCPSMYRRLNGEIRVYGGLEGFATTF